MVDVSGYPLAAAHPGYFIGIGTCVFTNDAPTGKTGQSLIFDGFTGIAISNSSTLDVSYDNTFDDGVNNAMSVAFWAKGWPGGWNPFVSKYGENGVGWQLRNDGNNNVSPCWTIRGTGGTVTLGTAVYGNPEDMAATSLTFANDGNWHFYAGTFNAITGERDLYVDGVLSAAETNNSVYALSAASYVCIGARDNGGNSFNQFFAGQIYDVRVYNYAITSPQVLQLYGVVAAVINVQPQPVPAFAGSTARISATVGGTPPLAYQWQLNGTNVNLFIDSTNFTGVNSNVLTVLNVTTNDVGSYRLIVTNNYAMAISSNAPLTLVQRSLVGEWFTGSSSLADVSGYSPAGIHDGYTVGGVNYVFTNDVPPGRTGNSLYLNATDTGIAINNSSTSDASYTNTFDDTINNAMTVKCWAKGWPGGWNPFVSKYGENGFGWQLRNDGNNNVSPCWTVRGAGGTVTLGTAVYGNAEDMAATSLTMGNDGLWHHYAGTYNASTGQRNLYVDGVLGAASTGNVKYNLAANSRLCVGARDAAGSVGNYFNGKVYDVRIYNYDLTSNQVQQLAALPDPVIRGQPPQSITAYIGGSAKISASGMGGTAPITNQWQFNNTNLVDGSRGGAIITGANSSLLTILNVTTNIQGVYHLIVSNPKGTTTSSDVVVTVLPTAPPPATNLVGAWFLGAASLADASGHSPAGTHDGYGVSGSGTNASNYGFANDVPPGMTGQSLTLGGNTAIAISNSSVLAAGYTNTFDDALTNMTVMLWAKGWPGTWNPFVSKYGENGAAWQLRRDGGSSPCWTLRGTGGAEDMSATSLTFSSDGVWHHYAGTFDGTSFVRNLYVDGALSASETGSTPYTMYSSAYLCIGGRDSGGNSFGNYFVGNIYDVRIYNVVLSGAQVNALITPRIPLVPAFSGPPVLYGHNLVLTWPFGTLLQATNVSGPWTATGATSPYTNNTSTAPRTFFRLRNP